MNHSNTHIYLKNGFIGLANIEGNNILKLTSAPVPSTVTQVRLFSAYSINASTNFCATVRLQETFI